MPSPLEKMFLEHPRSVGETYPEHLSVAWSVGARMITGGAACLVHGLLPFLFVKTGSRAVQELYERIVTQRARRSGARSPAAGFRSSADGYFDYVI